MKDLLHSIERSKVVLEKIKKHYDRQLHDPQDVELNQYIKTNVQAYGDLYKDLEDYVDDYRAQKSRLVRIARQYRWPLKRDDFQARFRKISVFEDSIKSLIQLDTGQKVTKIKDSFSFETWMKRLVLEDDYERNEYWQAYHYNKSEHSRPSWVLGAAPYKSWLSSKGSQKPWLWGIGEAGSGKSCTASFLAHSFHQNAALTAIAEDDVLPSSAVGVGVCVFYCSYKSNDRQDPETLMRCFIRQLIEQLREINPRIASQRAKDAQKLLSLINGRGHADFRKLLDTLCSDFQRTYFVVDALDEYSATYAAILSSIKAIESESLWVLLTSRPGLKEVAEDQNALLIDLSQNDEAMESFVFSHLNHIAAGDVVGIGQAWQSFLTQDKNRSMAARKILDAAENNFLQADLHMRALKDADSTDDLLHVLSSPSATVRDLVKDALNRVKQQTDEEDARQGMKALMWAIYSNESLTIPQLRNAMALSLDSNGQLEKHAISMKAFNKRRLMEITAYLLEFDDAAQSIRVHKAIRDYCVDSDVQQIYFPHVLAELTQVCLRCLDPAYLNRDTISTKDWKLLQREAPFLSYAVKNWAHHMSSLFQLQDGSSWDITQSIKTKQLVDMVLRLLQQTAFIQILSFGIQHEATDTEGFALLTSSNDPEVDEPTLFPIHILTYYQLHELMIDWIKAGNSPDLRSRIINHHNKGYTALWQACRASKEDTAILLLDHGADPTQENGRGEYILNQAVFRGLGRVVERIIGPPPHVRGKICIKQFDSYGHSALTSSIVSESDSRLDIFHKLMTVLDQIPNGQDLLFKRNNNNEVAIHEAARHNRPNIIRFLLKLPHGKEHLEQRGNGRWKETPLHLAASFAWIRSVKVLLNFGADTAARNSDGVVPLSLCVRQPHRHEFRQEVIEMLLEKTDPRSLDDAKRNVLHSAAEWGRPRNLNALLAKLPGSIVKELLLAKNKDGATPLIATANARPNGWKVCFNRCMKAMVGLISDDDARIVLAIKKEFPSDIRIPDGTFDQFIDPWELTDGGELALHKIIESGSLLLVSRVWEKMKNSRPDALELRDHDGASPLIVAVKWQYRDIVEYLVEAGADVNAFGVDGKTALHYAVELGFPKIANTLIPHARLDLADVSGMTPLAHCGRQNICRKMLEDATGQSEPKEFQWIEKNRVSTIRSEWAITVGDERDIERMRQGHSVVLGQIEWNWNSIPIGVRSTPYLVSEPIPKDVKLPISRVHVMVEGRDQGWSSDEWFKDRGEGSFTSDTGYELGIMRDEKIVLRYVWARNRHRAKDPYAFECSWHLDNELNKVQYGVHRVYASTSYQSRFVGSLRAGDRVVLLTTATGIAWTSIIKRAEVQIFEERYESEEGMNASSIVGDSSTTTDT